MPTYSIDQLAQGHQFDMALPDTYRPRGRGVIGGIADIVGAGEQREAGRQRAAAKARSRDPLADALKTVDTQLEGLGFVRPTHGDADRLLRYARGRGRLAKAIAAGEAVDESKIIATMGQDLLQPKQKPFAISSEREAADRAKVLGFDPSEEGQALGSRGIDRARAAERRLGRRLDDEEFIRVMQGGEPQMSAWYGETEEMEVDPASFRPGAVFSEKKAAADKAVDTAEEKPVSVEERFSYEPGPRTPAGSSQLAALRDDAAPAAQARTEAPPEPAKAEVRTVAEAKQAIDAWRQSIEGSGSMELAEPSAETFGGPDAEAQREPAGEGDIVYVSDEDMARPSTKPMDVARAVGRDLMAFQKRMATGPRRKWKPTQRGQNLAKYRKMLTAPEDRRVFDIAVQKADEGDPSMMKKIIARLREAEKKKED